MMKIQLVDDEPNVLRAMHRLLQKSGYEAHTFTDAEDALAALGEHTYAVIVVDYQMPHINGITYLQFAKQSQPDAVRMVLSGQSDRQSMLSAINVAEVYRYLTKPWDDFEILAALQAGVDLHMLRIENQRLLSQVSQQNALLRAQERELQRLERENPGLTRVDRDAQGMIVIGETTEDGV